MSAAQAPADSTRFWSLRWRGPSTPSHPDPGILAGGSEPTPNKLSGPTTVSRDKADLIFNTLGALRWEKACPQHRGGSSTLGLYSQATWVQSSSLPLPRVPQSPPLQNGENNNIGLE